MEKFQKNELSCVRGFDELYSEICSQLRKDEKFIDLGEKLRIASSDLSRVQLLVSDLPFVVRKFRNGIGESYERKSSLKSKEFFLHALKTRTGSRTTPKDAIDDLNKAIRTLSQSHCPPPTPTLRSLLTKTEGLSQEILQWFLQTPFKRQETRELDEAAGNAAVVVADENNDMELLSKIYLERSARFQETGDHESCILDIFAGLECGLEKTLELVYSVGESYKALGYTSSAKLIFQHYLQLLRLSSLNNELKSVQTGKVVRELKDIKSLEESGGRETITTKTTTMTSPVNRLADIMEFYDGPSPVLIAASDALELRYTPELGRHAVAKKRIPAGTTLIVDTPYAWSLCPAVYSNFCQHCCCRIWTRNWVPCQQCSSVVFCNPECRAGSEHYHKFECRILKLLNSSKVLGEMGLLSFRTIAKTPFNILLQFTNHVDDSENSSSPGTTNNDDNEFCPVA